MKKPNDAFFRLVRNFLTIYLPKNRCYSANTVKAYRDTINLFRLFMKEEKGIAFTGISFSLIDHSLVYCFMEWLSSVRKCSVATRNQRLAAMKSFLRYCATEEPELVAIYMDVQEVVALRNTQHPVQYLSQSALKAILRQPDENTRTGRRDQFFMILMYDTGGRIQEILDIRISDLALELDTPCVYLHGKGNKTRCVPLMDKTILHLKKYLERFHDIGSSDAHLFYTVVKGCKGQMSQDNASLALVLEQIKKSMIGLSKGGIRTPNIVLHFKNVSVITNLIQEYTKVVYAEITLDTYLRNYITDQYSLFKKGWC